MAISIDLVTTSQSLFVSDTLSADYPQMDGKSGQKQAKAYTGSRSTWNIKY